MRKTAKMTAEARFSEVYKKDQLALKEREKERKDQLDHVAKLRALRLEKERADKEAADLLVAEKTKASGSVQSRLPQTRRSFS